MLERSSKLQSEEADQHCAKTNYVKQTINWSHWFQMGTVGGCSDRSGLCVLCWFSLHLADFGFNVCWPVSQKTKQNTQSA